MPCQVVIISRYLVRGLSSSNKSNFCSTFKSKDSMYSIVVARRTRRFSTLVARVAISENFVAQEPEKMKLPSSTTRPSRLPKTYSELQLGLLLDAGEEIPQDKKAAFQCFSSVASKGNALAQYFLGEYYLLGTGVEKNEAEGFRFLKMSADQGIAHAQFGVGNMLLLGQGVPRNLESGLSYLRQAARQGHIMAQAYLHENRL